MTSNNCAVTVGQDLGRIDGFSGCQSACLSQRAGASRSTTLEAGCIQQHTRCQRQSQQVRADWSDLTCSLDWSGAKEMPRMGLMTRPNRMIWSTLLRTMSTGMAKPTPLLAPLGEYIAVLMPANHGSFAVSSLKHADLARHAFFKGSVWQRHQRYAGMQHWRSWSHGQIHVTENRQ